MEGWRRKIRCYVSPAGRNKIADWYNELSPSERADADAFIGTMRKVKEWNMPDYRPSLRGGGGLGELRWESSKKQHRLIGFFRGDAFIAVLGCTHKQQIYKPPDSLETAKRRKQEIDRGEVIPVEYDF